MAEAKRLGGPGAVTLDDVAFGAEFRRALVHESVRAELAARRRGTASTKTRGQVSGGGAKPWRQKGTGRARAGSSRSPLWTGGGTVFGPSPRHYTFKVNRKERRAALRCALSVHAARGSIAVFDPDRFEAPSTKEAAQLVFGWDVPRPLLVIIGDIEGDALGSAQGRAALSFRNLPRVTVLGAQAVGVADLIGARGVLCSGEAIAALTARAGAEVRG